MIDFSRYFPQRVFLVQGSEELFDVYVAAWSEKFPLLHALSVPRFTYEHAKSVATFASESTGEEKMMIIYFSAFSPEAAQVLLKSLEEPAEKTTIVFITRYPYLVPQTVRSRLFLMKSEEESTDQNLKEILLSIQKEATEKEDDAATRRSRALHLLDMLEKGIAHNLHDARVIYQAKEMIVKGNLPTKYVLDYLSTIIK